MRNLFGQTYKSNVKRNLRTGFLYYILFTGVLTIQFMFYLFHSQILGMMDLWGVDILHSVVYITCCLHCTNPFPHLYSTYLIGMQTIGNNLICFACYIHIRDGVYKRTSI